jgi:hypothetical protein
MDADEKPGVVTVPVSGGGLSIMPSNAAAFYQIVGQ